MLVSYGLLFILGAIVGSFLNALVFRLGTGVSMRGRSACIHCGRELVWFELVPVISFFALGGECRTCRSRISFRYPLVEIVVGALFVLTAVNYGLTLDFLLLLGIFSLIAAIVSYDIRHKIIPDTLLVPLLFFTAVFTVFVFAQNAFSADIVLLHLASSFAAFLFLAFLWFVSKGRWMGFGDGKFAAVLALSLSVLDALTMIVLAFWIGAAVGISALLFSAVLGKKTLTIKSEVPFAPYLAIGYALVIFTEVNILTIF